MRRLSYFLVSLVLSPALLRGAEAVEAAEPGVVEIAATAPAKDEAAWKPVEDARGSSRMAAALDAWLQSHPHGVQAARALVEQAALQENLLEAGATLRRARGEGQGSVWGARASLELAKLEYAQERSESALLAMEDAETWPRTEEMEGDWLYWRGQCRLVLKGFERAKADFERLVAGYPKHPKFQAAQLGLAECDAALKQDDKAFAEFEALYKDPQAPFGAQALWGAAVLRQRQKDVGQARMLFTRLRAQYPASFEAAAAQDHLEGLAVALVPTALPTPMAKGGRFNVQVGAFAKRASALTLQKTLKARRYPVKLQTAKFYGRTYYVVKVGPYKDRRGAEKTAKKLESRDRLRTRITEE